MDNLLQSLSPEDVDEVRRHVREGFTYCQKLIQQTSNGTANTKDRPVLGILKMLSERLDVPIEHRGSDILICIWLGQRYQRLAADVKLLEKDSYAGNGSLLRVMHLIAIILAVVVSTATCFPNAVNANYIGVVCMRTIQKIGADPVALFRAQGALIVRTESDKLVPDITRLADNPDVMQRIREDVFLNKANRVPSSGSRPRVIIVVGGTPNDRDRGLQAAADWEPMDCRSNTAICLTTDRVLAMIPGYDALTQFKTIDGTPVTTGDIVALYRPTLLKIIDSILYEAGRRRLSVFLSDNLIGNWLDNTRSILSGYHIGAVVVTPLVTRSDAVPVDWPSVMWKHYIKNRLDDYDQHRV